MGWLEAATARRAGRALERQLDYQRDKAKRLRGHEAGTPRRILRKRGSGEEG